MTRRLGVLLSASVLALADARAAYSPAGMTLLQEIVASNSATVDFIVVPNLAEQALRTKVIVLEFWGVRPATDDTYLGLRVTTNQGGAWKDSGYAYALEGKRDSDGPTVVRATSPNADRAVLMSTTAGLRAGNAANEDATGMIKFFAPTDTSVLRRFRLTSEYVDSNGRLWGVDGTGVWQSTEAVNGIRLLFSSGNISAGTFRLYALP